MRELFRDSLCIAAPFAWLLLLHGCGSRSDPSAQVLRNSRPEFRLLPLRDSMLFVYCLVAGRRLLPSERIAQHLSEWAQTAGIHENIVSRFCCKWYQKNVLRCTKSIKFCILHGENVLNGTKCVLFPILYRRNVLGGTKWIFASRIVRRGRVSRSDSSAQVLRNSRPEFRLLPLDTGWLNSWTTWRVRVLLYLSAIDRKSV